jgi:diguanylate cyclase (GGDEF)-like protein/PAS domain S-box-containing protein
MNTLSLISFFNAYNFILFGVYILILNRNEILNKLAAAVNFCFAVWAFSYTFFYSAQSAETAMFWHRISSFGWILYCGFAAHFFLILSGKTQKCSGTRWYILLYTLPAVLFLKSIFTMETPVAKGLVQSRIGWGWTYISNIGSMWFWVYIIYTLVYFYIALYYTYSWAKRSDRLRFLKQAKSIIFLDIVMIMIGFFTDLILPAISPIMPPVFTLLSIVWGVGFLYIVRHYKLMSVYDAASPDLILQTVMDPIIMLDDKGIIITCNKATEDLFMYNLKEIINKPFSDFCKSKEYGMQKLNAIFNKKSARDFEIDLIDSDRNIINALASFSAAESRLDGLVGIVLNIHDVTKLKKVEEELYLRKEKYKELSKHLDRLANYDELTNIPNRRLFFDKLEEAIENYRVWGNKFALVFIDLDGFKEINDSFGHDIGDLFLKNITGRFVNSIRKQDTIARVGGDEFVIIIWDFHNDSKLNGIIQRMKEMLARPIEINNCICPVGASFGISKCPEDGETSDELMKIADERMYKDKSSRKTRNR